jgi:hypothetical protein
MNQETIQLLRDYEEQLAADQTLGKALACGVGIGLTSLRDNQAIVSRPVAGAIPLPGVAIDKDALRTYILAMMIETAEFCQTLPWKPWKDGAIDKERTADEFADILAFMGVILVHLNRMGITPAMLGEAYRKKSVVNIQRFLGDKGAEYDRTKMVQGSLFDSTN